MSHHGPSPCSVATRVYASFRISNIVRSLKMATRGIHFDTLALATLWLSDSLRCSASPSSRYQRFRLRRTNDKRPQQTSPAISLRFEQLSMYLITLPMQAPCAAILALRLDSTGATIMLPLLILCCKSMPYFRPESTLIITQLRAVFKHSAISGLSQLLDAAQRCTYWTQ